MSKLKKVQIFVIAFSILLFSIHLIALNFFIEERFQDGPWWLSYVYLMPVTIIGITLFYKKFEKEPKSAIKTFFVYSIIKMFGALILLLPWLIDKQDFSRPMVAQFFIVFFPYLLVETILLVRLLNQSFDEKIKNE